MKRVRYTSAQKPLTMNKYELLDIALRMVVAIILAAVVAGCLYASQFIDIQTIVGSLLTVVLLPLVGGSFSMIIYLVVITIIDVMNS